MMQDTVQETSQSLTASFSSVMELMADLSDKDVTHVRAETYASDLIQVVSAMRSAFNADTEINQHAAQFLFFKSYFVCNSAQAQAVTLR